MNAQNVTWQTATAVVQAVSSIILLAWYVLAAHLARRQVRRERTEAFDSLVTLCRDLGADARIRTSTHLDAAARAPDGDPQQHFAAWRAEMRIIYVCLDVVPHYEVRNPAFSQALTRLWCEVDLATLEPDSFEEMPQFVAFLTAKFERIRIEVDAMNALLTSALHRRAWRRAQRCGAYTSDFGRVMAGAASPNALKFIKSRPISRGCSM